MDFPCHPVRRTIAKGHICTVEECSCGVLHVSLGVLTVRLQAEVVASVWATLGEALERIAARPPVHSLHPNPSERPS